MPPTEFGRIFYNYDKSIISELDWHGGCTWYSKENGHDGNKFVIKVGCDYQHLWDNHQYYDLEHLQIEVKKTIDSLWVKVPKLKVHCYQDGGWYEIGEKHTRKKYDKDFKEAIGVQDCNCQQVNRG
jgi:hypothetical protein